MKRKNLNASLSISRKRARLMLHALRQRRLPSAAWNANIGLKRHMSASSHFAKRNNARRQLKRNNRLKLATQDGDAGDAGDDEVARMAPVSKSSRLVRSLRLKISRHPSWQAIHQSPESWTRRRPPLTERCSRMLVCKRESLIRFMRGNFILRMLSAPPK